MNDIPAWSDELLDVLAVGFKQMIKKLVVHCSDQAEVETVKKYMMENHSDIIRFIEITADEN